MMQTLLSIIVIVRFFVGTCAISNRHHEIARITVTNVRVDTFPDRFIEWYIIDAPKIGLPGRPFRLAINWTTSDICITSSWFRFSDSYRNGTDILYLPRSATRLPLLADPVQCEAPAGADGVIGMGPQSPLWETFGVVTVDLTLRNHPAGAIVMGDRNPEAFAELNGPRLFVHCDVFPTQCWMPGTIWTQSVRVFFAVGEHTILLGADLWAQFVNDSARIASPIQIQFPGQPIDSFTIEQLTEIEEDVVAEIRDSEGWARMAQRIRLQAETPAWSVLRRPIVHLCETCALPTDVVLGTMTLGVAIVMNADRQYLEIGAQYERSRWTIWNTLFFLVLVMCLVHFYMNPASQLPAFMGHENESDPRVALGIKNQVFLQRLRQYSIEDEEEEMTMLVIQPTVEIDETDENDAKEELKNRRKATTTTTSSRGHDPRREVLRARRELQQKLWQLHRQLFVETQKRVNEVFSLITFGPEVLGIVTVLVTLIVNVAFLDFGRRVQFVLLVPSDSNEATGEPALIILLAVTLGSLFLVHMIFFFATPPCPIHRPFGAKPNFSLLLLVRRAVAEAELHVAMWITLVEGPLETYYQLLSFLNCTFALHSNAKYLSIYIHNLAVRKHWVLTSMLILIHSLFLLLFGAFALQPLWLLMWKRYEDTTTAWLLTLNTYAILWMIAAFTQRRIAFREKEYVELLHRSVDMFQTRSRASEPMVREFVSV